MNESHENLVQSFVSISKGPSLRSTHLTIDPECRICLEGLNEEGKLSPCKCSGSVGWVHFNCMSEWIARNHTIPLVDIARWDHYTCEMCKSRIPFQVDKKIQCHNLPHFMEYYRRDRAIFFVLSAISIGFLALLGFVVDKAVSGAVSSEDGKWFQSAIIVTAIVVILVIQLFCTYVLVRRFMMAVRARIVRIGMGKGKKTRERTHSTCTSEANMVSMERKVRDHRIIPEIIVYDIE